MQRDQNVTVKTTAAIKEAMRKLAADERRTLSQMAEILFIEGLQRRERLPPGAAE